MRKQHNNYGTSMNNYESVYFHQQQNVDGLLYIGFRVTQSFVFNIHFILFDRVVKQKQGKQESGQTTMQTPYSNYNV